MVKKKWRAAIFCLFISLSFYALTHAVSPLSLPREKVMASEFTLVDLGGKKVSLSDFKGSPVILFFWATWCPYCREEFPELIKEYPKMKSKKIVLLAIDMREPKYKAENFLKGKNIEFPVLLDEDLRVSPAYDVIGIPTFVLIDSSGLIQFTGNILPSDYGKILKSE